MLSPDVDATFQPITQAPLTQEPLVSVLVTNYNYGRYLGQALVSVLEQTYPNLELIVCDDGSTDESTSVISSIAQSDTRLIPIFKENAGQASAFNAAFDEANGEIVCFLDSDDWFVAHKLERIVEAMRKESTGAALHRMVIRGSNGEDIQAIPTFTAPERGWLGPKVVARGGRWRWMPTSALCLRRGVCEMAFPVPELKLRTDADTYLLMLAPLLATVSFIPDVLSYYRLHGENSFTTRRFTQRSAARTLTTVETAISLVNDRLTEMGMEERLLDPSRNLEIQQQQFLSNALSGKVSRPRLVRQYWELAPSIMRDDLYSRLQRVWALMLFLVVILLPTSLRARWVSRSLSASRAKERARRFFASRR